MIKDMKHIPTSENERLINLWVNEGYLDKWDTFQLNLFCEMKFDNYPMDTQKCRFRVMNPVFDNRTLQLFMDPEAGIKYNQRVPQRLLPYEIDYEEMEEEEKTVFLKGTFASVVGFNVLLKRR